MTSAVFAPIRRQRTILLETRKRDGSWIATPVAPAVAGDRLLVGTFTGAWKAKRIANFPEVALSPCTFRGKVTGPRVLATARLLESVEAASAYRTLRRRFPFVYGVLVPIELRLRRATGLYYELVLSSVQ